MATKDIKFKSTYGKYTAPNTYPIEEELAKKLVGTGFAEYAKDSSVSENKEIVNLTKLLDKANVENAKLLKDSKTFRDEKELVESKYSSSLEQVEKLGDELHALKIEQKGIEMAKKVEIIKDVPIGDETVKAGTVLSVSNPIASMLLDGKIKYAKLVVEDTKKKDVKK